MLNRSARRIYLSPPDMGRREKELMLKAFKSNWVSTVGPEVDAFEREMCERLGVGHAVALSCGTAALHLALIGVGVSRGDEVFCSDLTFAATANPVIYCGASPVFVDSTRDTWNMDPDLLAEALKDRRDRGRLPKAVVVVDLYGQCPDYGAIDELCRQYDVPLIEDAAEALGATYAAKSAGTLGKMGVLSFNGNKIITTSGGGMLVSDNSEYTRKARFLATQARDPFSFYQHSHVGYNYRLSNTLAAIGRGQLLSLDKKLKRRREINHRYREALTGVPGIEFMPEAPYGKSNCWLTCILVQPDLFGGTSNELRLFLEARNIESRHVWKPMHMQPVFQDCSVYGGSVSEDLFDHGLCLPSGSGLAEADLNRICDLILCFHATRANRGNGKALITPVESLEEATVAGPEE